MTFLHGRKLIAMCLTIAISSLANARPFEDTMAQRLLACTACHGDQGRAGPDGYYPRLAGKPAGYLYSQLVNFREGRRHYAPMGSLLEPLSDAYLRDIADHFASITVPYAPPTAAAVSPKVLARGKALATQGDPARKLPACTHCHGSALTGTEPNIPGLLGLPRDYLNAQLGGWKTGQRKARTPDCMKHIAQQMSDEDISAVTSWLSSQPVPGNAKAAPAMTAAVLASKSIQCGSSPSVAVVETMPLSRGAYLARIGNCASCHTARGGEPYAGGRAIETPFGPVYAGNLTPDPLHGIGQWTAEDFWQALHNGKSRDGRLLNPAFPYTSYTHISREDSDALWTYLRTVAPSSRANTPHALHWPVGTQLALRAWRLLYFTPDQAPASHAGSDSSQRGAYLVQGLGHCAQCHAQRNMLGGIASTDRGGLLPGSPWYAPSLHGKDDSLLAAWSVQELQTFLVTGRNAQARASGPMAEVVVHGTQYLTAADAKAMATFLKANASQGLKPSARSEKSKSPDTPLTKGGALYEDQCSQCHGKTGLGQANAYPALAGNRTILRANTSNLILKVLHGGFEPATTGNPRPFGMPPFLLTMNDAEIAAVLTYIRTAWGNSGSAVNEFDINRIRASSRP